MDVQHVVEGAIRALGCLTLFAVTLGRYRGQKDGLLLEGGVGLSVVVAVSYAALTLA